MLTRRIAYSVLVVVSVAACGDQVVLRDGVDGITLTYRCMDIQAQATSSAERAMVRGYSGHSHDHRDRPQRYDRQLLQGVVQGKRDEYQRRFAAILAD